MEYVSWCLKTNQMRHFFTLLVFALMSSLHGQVVYPYNPDANADAFIATEDLTSFLALFAADFQPSEPVVVGCKYTGWCLPLEEVGPALFLMHEELPPGYSYAENQECAAQVILDDAFCVDNHWDDICTSAYNNCVDAGGCTMSISNFLSSASSELGILRNRVDNLENVVSLISEELIGCHDPNYLEFSPESLIHSDSECESFISCGEPIVYQGHTYQTVEVAGSCWFAENLRATEFRDGTEIPSESDVGDK